METKIIGSIAISTIVIIGAGIFLLSRGQTSVPQSEILSQNGLHWHSKLRIFVKGKEQEIPANIGIAGNIHQPIHTHEKDNVIHLEFSGIVKKNDTKIGRFFTIWGKKFSATCIFDNCNETEGKVKMTVNSKESKEFENYRMRDGDNIEIRFE